MKPVSISLVIPYAGMTIKAKKTTKLMEEKTFFLKNNCKAFVMRQENSLDIDNQIDLDFAKYRIINI